VELKFYTMRKADRKKERAYKRRKKAFIEGQLAGPSTIPMTMTDGSTS
jgi:hypothetical protein